MNRLWAYSVLVVGFDLGNKGHVLGLGFRNFSLLTSLFRNYKKLSTAEIAGVVPDKPYIAKNFTPCATFLSPTVWVHLSEFDAVGSESCRFV